MIRSGFPFFSLPPPPLFTSLPSGVGSEHCCHFPFLILLRLFCMVPSGKEKEGGDGIIVLAQGPPRPVIVRGGIRRT